MLNLRDVGYENYLFLGLYGALFRRNKEAAFSNYRLWESLGFVIAYAYSTAICAQMKLYIVISVLALGTICYIIVEIRQLRKVSFELSLILKFKKFESKFFKNSNLIVKKFKNYLTVISLKIFFYFS